jgi:hypothetical protein
MSLVGFEPAVAANERSQTDALDRVTIKNENVRRVLMVLELSFRSRK